jgi:hypothetical protein
MSRAPAPWKSSDVAWNGRRRPYDLLKEVTVSGIIVAVLAVGLSVLFASPDPPSVTFKEWSAQGTKDFVRTTLSEIDGTSLSATYGPPYQTTEQNGSTQGFGPLSPEKWFGQTIPVDTWKNYVVFPLKTLSDPRVDAAIAQWDAADQKTQDDWVKAYRAGLETATPSGERLTVTPQGDAGPLPVLLDAQVAMARTGALDAALLYNQDLTKSGAPVWFSNDQTFALLYFGDSGVGGGGPDCISAGQALPANGECWFYNQSVSNTAPRFGGFLDGGTWGVINEVGNWPGAWWLFLYSFWYQWGPGVTSASADLYAMLATGAIAVIFLLTPYIPGLRNIPKATGVYKLMWSEYCKSTRR